MDDNGNSTLRKGIMLSYVSQGVEADENTRILVEEYSNYVSITDSVLEARFKLAEVSAGVVDVVRQAVVQGSRNYVHEIGAAQVEVGMYGPLSDMIAAVIHAVSADERLYHRHTMETHSRKTDSSVELMGTRRPSCTTFVSSQFVGHFRHSLVLWELKHRSSLGPGSSETAHPKEIICQVADVVRLRAGSRPHQLFSLAIMICGTSFWVSMWDQSGMTYSHQHSLEHELELFLRLVISVSCRMSAVDFGKSPDIQFPANYMFGPSATTNVRGDDLRQQDFRESPNGLELIGHPRARFGKAIYQYDTDLELMRGTRDILKGLMAMNQFGWMHWDVSVGNCLLTCDPADGPSLILDMELAEKIDRQAPASKTAISGTIQFMARQLLKSLVNQKDSDFVYLPQYDLESLVYVLAYAVMKKECVTKTVKSKNDTKLAEMTDLYHQAFGHGTIPMIGHPRLSLLDTWERYQSVVAGKHKPSILHNIVSALLDQVKEQYVVQATSQYRDFEDDSAAHPAVPLNDKRMRRLLKLGIADQKAYMNKTSPDSDVDADYD